VGSAGFEPATRREVSFSILEPLLSFFTTDCQRVKEIQSRGDKEFKGDSCVSSDEDISTSDRQTDSKMAYFSDLPQNIHKVEHKGA
jgi:hypothetical protein